jgi:hypothetical protein
VKYVNLKGILIERSSGWLYLAIFIIQMYAYARWLPDQGDRFFKLLDNAGEKIDSKQIEEEAG